MFTREKPPSIDPEQHELLENAQRRIIQKRRLYHHFVVLLIGAVFLVLINKVFNYGEPYNWYIWVLVIWVFIFLIHAYNVFVTQRFMGKKWERRQREKLVQKQQERIQKMASENPASGTSTSKGRRIMIAAAGKNNELGKDNRLMWHLPDDFKRFRQLTTGHPIIMGRKTFESFPKPLPKRKHIIISRNTSYTVDHPECIVVHSLQTALDAVPATETAFIIGGGEIYRQALPFCDTIELTRVESTFEADTYFPSIDLHDWDLVATSEHPADERHPYPFRYETYKRIGS